MAGGDTGGIDARVAELRDAYAAGEITDDQVDAEVRALAVVSVAASNGRGPAGPGPLLDFVERLSAAVAAGCRAYIDHRPGA